VPVRGPNGEVIGVTLAPAQSGPPAASLQVSVDDWAGCGYLPLDASPAAASVPPPKLVDTAALRAVGEAFAAVFGHERVARELGRREIDEVLAADARACPAFATARRAAVLAYIEARPIDDVTHGLANLHRWLANLHRYEELRGGGRTPSREAWLGVRYFWFSVYERARSLP
jgi:hypothetical protein